MPIEEVTRGTDFLGMLTAGFGVKAFLILFLVFYTFFALILFRQVQLMDRALPNSLSGFLKFLGIIHLGISLALLFIVLGAF